jgi:hypothetical protein
MAWTVTSRYPLTALTIFDKGISSCATTASESPKILPVIALEQGECGASFAKEIRRIDYGNQEEGNGPTRDDAKEAIAQEFVRVIAQDPVNKAGVPAAQECAFAAIDALSDIEAGHSINYPIFGMIGYTLDKSIISVNVSIQIQSAQ